MLCIILILLSLCLPRRKHHSRVLNILLCAFMNIFKSYYSFKKILTLKEECLWQCVFDIIFNFATCELKPCVASEMGFFLFVFFALFYILFVLCIDRKTQWKEGIYCSCLQALMKCHTWKSLFPTHLTCQWAPILWHLTSLIRLHNQDSKSKFS